MVFICNFLKVGRKLVIKASGVSTGLVRVKAIAVFITRTQFLAETLLREKNCAKR